MKKKFSIILAVALCAIAAISYGTTDSLREASDGSTGRTTFTKSTKDANGIHVRHTRPEPNAAASADVHAPASNTAAVVTYAATSGKKHVITGIAWSYVGAGTLSGGNLKVEDVSGTVVFSQDIQAVGQGVITFPVPLRSAANNTALIVTLAAGSANVTGKVSVLNHWTE